MKRKWTGLFVTLVLSCAVVITVSAGGGGKAGTESTKYSAESLQTETVQEETKEAVRQSDSTQKCYEELPVPDFEELGVLYVPNEERRYNVEAYKGKIYVSGDSLRVRTDGKESPVILVYDEKSEEWGTILATFLSVDGKLQTVIGDGSLYLLSNNSGKLTIFSYDLESKMVNKLAVLECSRYEIGQSLVYDGTYIWMIGGKYQDSDSKKWIPDNEIRRFSIKSKKLETAAVKLEHARTGAAAELVNDKIVVTGGENTDGKWETTTEIIDCETETIDKAASFPAVYEEQDNFAASGVFEGKMIVAGMYTDASGAVDTVLYDSEADQWTSVPQAIADTKVLFSEGTVSGAYFYVYGTVQNGTDKTDRTEVFRRIRIQ